MVLVLYPGSSPSVSHKFEMLVKYVTSGLGTRLIYTLNLLVCEPFGLVHKQDCIVATCSNSIAGG